jgi:hypothetical protein
MFLGKWEDVAFNVVSGFRAVYSPSHAEGVFKPGPLGRAGEEKNLSCLQGPFTDLTGNFGLKPNNDG